MKKIAVKTAAVIGAGMLALTMTGCHGSDSAASKPADSKANGQSAEQKEMPKMTLADFKSKLSGKKIAGVELTELDMKSEENQNMFKTLKDISSNGNITPKECGSLVDTLIAGFSDFDNVDHVGIMGAKVGDKLRGIIYDASPSDKDKNNFDEPIKLKDKCKAFEMSMDGRKLNFKFDAHELNDYKSIADKAQWFYGTTDQGKPLYSYRLFLKNGQIITSTGVTDDITKAGLDDGLKALGLENK